MEFTRLLQLAIRTILAGILGKSEPSNIYLEVLLGICSHRYKKKTLQSFVFVYMRQPTSQGLGWYGLDLALEPSQGSYKPILHPLPAWYCDVTPCVILVQSQRLYMEKPLAQSMHFHRLRIHLKKHTKRPPKDIIRPHKLTILVI